MYKAKLVVVSGVKDKRLPFIFQTTQQYPEWNIFLLNIWRGFKYLIKSFQQSTFLDLAQYIKKD